MALVSNMLEGVEENELLDYQRRVMRSIIESVCPVWSTAITKGQSESLEQIQKCDMYIIAPHMEFKEVIIMFNSTLLY